ncbi:hypothetical protein SAMN05892883_3695 [Jatrophihabitans sp. GAS493]|uniref:hypothetical protein n=1 Tax=Jatrophihabitans sp. GAS493 TaxID=1907575 RepID=UPI000BB99BF9|nr:hypothetical protein [Jatrophihabitans sp. GAS493]SOD74509.1 hypothetical protein SAMN05892883_3695 [Jatrophihabitans sp. GAS493]
MFLPSAKSVKDVIEATIGRDCEIAAVDKISPVDGAGGMIVTYWDDQAKNQVAILWSPEAAAFVGSAFALLPPLAAKEMAAERDVRIDVIENLVEVCNVVSAVFEHPRNPGVRLNEPYFPLSQAPTELVKHMYQHFDRVDYDLTVDNYGTGKISFVAIG